MDYEKKYKEALERAKQFSEKPYLEDSKGIVGYIFPELAESEDERIRKSLIDMLKNDEKCYLKEIAWLEKQGEQKPAVIIPKFRVGDEIKTSNEESLTITKIDEKGYWSEGLFICGFDDADKWELVEQKPAEWSKEDERNFDIIYGIIYNSCIAEDASRLNTWLLSLKPKKQWKPSDNELEVLRLAAEKDGTCLMGLYEQLKKLKE